MEKRIIYADNAATTQVSKPVLEAMLPYLTGQYGNPSSIYALGRHAQRDIELARQQVAEALGCEPGEIFFTGCGTESDNWAIRSTAVRLGAKGKRHIVTSVFEHHAVLHTCAALEKEGFEVTYLPVSREGLLTAQQVADAIREDTHRLEGEIAQLKIKQEENDAESDRMNALMQKTLEDRAEAEASKTRAERDAQEKNKDILNMERACALLEQKKVTSSMEEKQIVDKLWDSYGLTPGIAPEHRGEIENVTAGNRRGAELKRKIAALGTPNLGAIEEYARVNERYTYLAGQRDDVLTSKRELESVIRDITKEMTTIFVSEFGKIDHYFGQTFEEMFGGGKGQLILEDPENPLTCGIEIRVQPPGKQVKTITLLSGGEKAFVATALYFAILKVRPTPFCLLDEIDAALDDRNVERFASYLHNLAKKTQFIVITHRRGTMEASDVLYGVTMQEQGVSKLLRLDLNQMEEYLGIVE